MLQLLVIACSLLVASAYYQGGWDPAICCYPPGEACCPTTAAGCPVCLDVAILADRSSSVGEFRYRQRIIPFLRHLVRSPQWTVGTGPEEFQFSVTTFAGNPLEVDSSATLHWNWGSPETMDRNSLRDAINSIRNITVGGLTLTEVGMAKIREEVLYSPGDRPDCSNLCMVITDGGSTREPEFEAELVRFKEACDRIITVGVNTTVDEAELNALASASEFVVKLADFPDVPSAIPTVADKVCDVRPICPSCLDILIIQDLSSSVGPWRFQQRVRPFLRNFHKSRRWMVGFDSPDSMYQFAMVTFNNVGTLEWNWGSSNTYNRTNLKNSLSAIDPDRATGVTNMGDAFDVALRDVLNDGNTANRPACADVCVIVSDGAIREQDITVDSGPTPVFDQQLPLFKAKCDKIIVLGISTFEDPTQLESIATSADEVLIINAATPEDFEMVFEFIPDQLCTETPPTAPPSADCCPYDFPQYARNMVW